MIEWRSTSIQSHVWWVPCAYHVQDCLVLKAFFATLPAVYRVTDLIVTCSLVPCARLPCTKGFFTCGIQTHMVLYTTCLFPALCVSRSVPSVMSCTRMPCPQGLFVPCARLPCTQGLFTMLPALYFLTSHVQVLPCLRSYCHLYHVQDCLVLKAFYATLPAVYRVTDLIVTCSLVPCARLPCTCLLYTSDAADE